MDINEKISKILLALNAGKNVSVQELIEVIQFDNDNPYIGQGFVTQVQDPSSIIDITVTQISVLSCGHQFAGQVSKCSCGRTHCQVCAENMKRCAVCNAPIAQCCMRHSHISNKDYCRRHRHAWLLGR